MKKIKTLLMLISVMLASEVALARDVTVAIIDTGLDLDEINFRNHLWQNPGETGLDRFGKDKSNNGIDDDDNGYVDDVHGWDFVAHSNRAIDHHGHGTHIAGIILQGRSVQTIGKNQGEIKLMILKYYDTTVGNDPIGNSRKALRYAIDQGADIINYSGGGPRIDSVERNLIDEANRKGVLLIAAAGNEGANTSLQPFFPASYPMDNVVSVAAHDRSGKLLPLSNYGQKVDLVAPGFEILSNIPGGLYGRMSGTSQATAFVTATAAHLSALFPTKPSVQFLKKQILLQTVHAKELKAKIPSTAKLNWPISGVASLE